ncbi:ABC-type transport system, involved in lipoprotein release, permease component [Zhouia amylolytica AD3]|uniref:ABC-type transport system, involved in lipoprotein release, permease component n=2 Tax=Zhouia amylolytica TaxID=376730 RepID=W2UL17_9FLAO|nr:ABC-type transport system, involved in lipoprotein release, permease component [Zhouia amylolytica AD3]
MVTFLVIVIGAASLFIVLSAFAGLKTFSLSFANAFDPDLKIVPVNGKVISFDSETNKKLEDIDGIASYSRELEERVFLMHDQKNHVAYIKGVDENYNLVTKTDSTLYVGEWLNVYPDQVVTGIGIANILGLAVNDRLNSLVIMAPKPGTGPIRTSQKKPYNTSYASVSGVYAVNEDLDKKYVFAHLSTVQGLLERGPSDISGINIKLKEGADTAVVSEEIATAFDNQVDVKTRAELNATLYKMLNTENLAIYLIFTLVLIIALFNLVGAIIMMVLDKKSNLKTLYSLGITIKGLRQIYFYQGLIVSAVGGIIGILIGFVLTWTQKTFGWFMITPSLPYPMDLTVMNFVVVLFTILILGYLAAKIASLRINRKLID